MGSPVVGDKFFCKEVIKKIKENGAGDSKKSTRGRQSTTRRDGLKNINQVDVGHGGAAGALTRWVSRAPLEKDILQLVEKKSKQAEEEMLRRECEKEDERSPYEDEDKITAEEKEARSRRWASR